jgi:cellobiose-specific phosphotransferase system component IIA
MNNSKSSPLQPIKPAAEVEYSIFEPHFLTAAKRLVRAHAIQESVRQARITDRAIRLWRPQHTRPVLSSASH